MQIGLIFWTVLLVTVWLTGRLKLTILSACLPWQGISTHTRVFFSVMWENTMSSSNCRQRTYSKRAVWGKPTSSSLSTVVCRSATLFSYFLCTLAKMSSIFFRSYKHETEAVRGEGGLESLRGAFIGLYRGSLWGESKQANIYTAHMKSATLIDLVFYKRKSLYKSVIEG